MLQNMSSSSDNNVHNVMVLSMSGDAEGGTTAHNGVVRSIGRNEDICNELALSLKTCDLNVPKDTSGGILAS